MFRPLSSLLAAALILATAQSCASPLSPASQASTLAQYHKLFDAHRKEMCPAGLEPEFERLLKKFRGHGNWVPELAGDVDYVTVEKLLPEMEKKLKWIQSQRALLLKKKSIPGVSITEKIETDLKELLKHKYVWDTATDEGVRRQAAAASLRGLEKLRSDWKRLLERVPYLTNYSFPVDHLKNRKIYDEFRDRNEPTSQQIANYAFFYRRLLEDGAYNPDHTSSDSWFRTTLDTVHLEIQRPMVVVEEDLRYDLEFILARLRKELERGRPALAARLGEWEERTSKALQFYRDLIDPDNRAKSRALIKEKNQATLQLKEWVASHQAKSWLWWSRQNETMKALYSIETILYNEVGNVDADEALERLDVAQVVVNRKNVPFYRTLDPVQELYPLLRKDLSEKEIQSEDWLNILYRRGEFSFTYYYMPGAVKAFCPDMSPTGKRLQQENLEIALALLREPRQDFAALRYFSRASMPGRINMASVWEDYQRLPERPGLIVDGQDKLRAQMKNGDLKYLYQFTSPESEVYRVYESGNKIYVARMLEGQWVFYSWRNPHYFIYFGLKKTPSTLK